MGDEGGGGWRGGGGGSYTLTITVWGRGGGLIIGEEHIYTCKYMTSSTDTEYI